MESILQKTKLKPRTLPLVLPANPVSWGKPGRLSTAEALASTLFILGREYQSSRLLSCLPYGDTFLELHRLPLEAYSKASSNDELAEIQWDFFDKPEET